MWNLKFTQNSAVTQARRGAGGARLREPRAGPDRARLPPAPAARTQDAGRDQWVTLTPVDDSGALAAPIQARASGEQHSR